MTVFGITGGSGSGKTSVSAILSEFGVCVIDTDLIAHKITEPKTKCLDELTDYFGKNILNSDGKLNRKKLASIAFSDNEKKAVLNKITHKYIKTEVIKDIECSNSELIAIDGAVIIGSDIEPLCEFIVSVIADRNIRIERIKERDNLTDEQALKRLDAQPKDEFYKENSLYIIYNNGSSQELRESVCELYNIIKEV